MASHNSPQTGLMAVYDADDTTIMINGQQVYGFGQDQMFSTSYDNDNVVVNQDPQGTSVASKQHKTGGTVTINISEASPANAQLTNLANAETEFPMDIITTTTHWTASHCLIVKIPDGGGGATAANRAWQIKALNLSETSLVQG